MIPGSARVGRGGAMASGPSVADLYRTYGPVVYRRCLRLLHDREAARDATQEVFVRLLRDEEVLAEPDRALRWIYRVAMNQCLNVLRDLRQRGESADEGSLGLLPAPSVAFSDRQLARSVLARFDAQTQAVAGGVLIDGLEQEELADALGISRRTVYRKLKRFLRKARALVGREP